MAIGASARGYVAGKYGLELGGQMAGWVASASGGGATSDVIAEKLGVDHLIRKHIGGLKYTEIEVHVGTGMSKDFYDWIKSSFAHTYGRKDGAILVADYNGNEVSRLEFTHALISEIGFPALDAASKDAALMVVKLAPEVTRFKKATGKIHTAETTIHKKWLPSNFRLRIDGLDCTRVNKIESLVVKQKNVDNPVGEMRDYQREPAYLEIPNLVVTLAESHSADWYQWHEDFVIRGNNGEDKVKSGTLELLAANLQDTLFTINFKHTGIFRLEPERVETHSDAIRRVTAQLYVEDMQFEVGGAASAK